MIPRINRACVAVSGLARPELVAKKISCLNALCLEILLLRSTDRRGQMPRLLCACGRSTRQVEIQPADIRIDSHPGRS
jgi:hypothetical protein